MKKKWLFIVSVTVLYFGISFLVVSWLSYFSNPKRIDVLPQEQILFDKLKKEYGFDEISRTPETERKLLYPKDTISYELYLRYIDCNKSKKYYKRIADSIAKSIKHNINLNDNFYKYNLFFYCNSRVIKPNEVIVLYEYSYLKKEVK